MNEVSNLLTHLIDRLSLFINQVSGHPERMREVSAVQKLAPNAFLESFNDVLRVPFFPEYTTRPMPLIPFKRKLMLMCELLKQAVELLKVFCVSLECDTFVELHRSSSWSL